jgi:uncharacterized protein (DUF433 family)
MAELANFDWKSVTGVGLYTVPLAARLIGEKDRVVRSWLEGYSNSGAEPIIKRQLPAMGNRTVFGFLDLVEARFVKHFCDLGLSPQSIRKVAVKLRIKHQEDHPFATNKRFRTDGKRIFLEVAETEEERRIIDVLTDHFVMASVIDQSLFETILYAHDLAYRWRPLRELNLIVLDPKIAFGKPVIDAHWITTQALYSAFRVEGSYGAVADDFEVIEEGVRQAVEFERSLAEAVH